MAVSIKKRRRNLSVVSIWKMILPRLFFARSNIMTKFAHDSPEGIHAGDTSARPLTIDSGWLKRPDD